MECHNAGVYSFGNFGLKRVLYADFIESFIRRSRNLGCESTGAQSLSVDTPWEEIEVKRTEAVAASNEGILGDKANWVSVFRYADAHQYKKLGRSVGRLDIMQRKRWHCSGFLISDDLLLTNAHCVDVRKNGRIRKMRLVMGYDRQFAGEPYSVETNPVAVNREYDIAVLRVNGTPGRKWGSLKLASQFSGSYSATQIIHHPDAMIKKVSFENCSAQVARGNVNLLLHTCDTFEGSSGSPVLSSSGEVVGIHYAGPKDRDLAELYNFARPVTLIRGLLRDAKVNLDSETQAPAALVETAAATRSFSPFNTLRYSGQWTTASTNLGHHHSCELDGWVRVGRFDGAKNGFVELSVQFAMKSAAKHDGWFVPGQVTVTAAQTLFIQRSGPRFVNPRSACSVPGSTADGTHKSTAYSLSVANRVGQDIQVGQTVDYRVIVLSQIRGGLYEVWLGL